MERIAVYCFKICVDLNFAMKAGLSILRDLIRFVKKLKAVVWCMVYDMVLAFRPPLC
jgi:hypothetical protein